MLGKKKWLEINLLMAAYYTIFQNFQYDNKCLFKYGQTKEERFRDLSRKKNLSCLSHEMKYPNI